MAQPFQKADQFRGVVLGSSWRHIHTDVEIADMNPLQFKVVGLDYCPQNYSIETLVRRSILYFDRLEWPTNNLMPQGELLHGEYLEREGVIHRSKIEFQNFDPMHIEMLRSMMQHKIAYNCKPGDVPELLANAHVDIFRNLDAQSPGRWAFATIGDGMDSQASLEEGLNSQFRSGLLELYDVLPVPAVDVPYADILEYRQKYKSELLELRARMDEMYRSIENDIDRPLARNAEIDKLETALGNVAESLHAAKLKYRLEYCGIQLSWPGLIDIGAKLAMAGAGGLGPRVALALAISSCIQFTPRLRRSQVEIPQGFKYIYQAHRDDIL